MRLYPPLPISEAFTPAYLAARGDFNRDFAWMMQDAQGMPGPDGRRFHGGVDWFAPGGTVCRSPEAGIVRRVVTSLDRVGPVFGGTIVIEHSQGGCTTVMRHVDPIVELHTEVKAGEPIARVTDWASGGDHAHIELWKAIPRTNNPWGDGYKLSNTFDPKDVNWDETVMDVTQPEMVMYHFENPPWDRGGTGPRELGPWVRWTDQQEEDYQNQRRRGRLLSKHVFDGKHWLLEWAEGTYNNPYFFSYAALSSRDNAHRIWEARLGTKLRRFKGRANSVYRHKGGK